MIDPAVRKFCKLFHKALDKDGWGDIDPHLFKVLGDGGPDEDDAGDAEYLNDLLCLANAVTEAMIAYEKTR